LANFPSEREASRGSLIGVNVKSACSAVALSLSFFTVAACNTPPPATNVVDAGPLLDTGPIIPPTLTTASGPPDMTCLRHATAPTPGAPLAMNLHVTEFLSMGHTPIVSQPIEIYTDNVLGSTCSPPSCSLVTTDATGRAPFTFAAGDWFAFRISANGQTNAVIAINQPAASVAGADVELPAFSPTSVTAIARLLNREFDPTMVGALSGRVLDCAGTPLMNVRIRVFSGDTEIVSGPIAAVTSPRITGIVGSSLTRNALTGTSGDFVGADVPPGSDYRVEAWAVLSDGAPESLIGCELGIVEAGSVFAEFIGPLRSDYAAGSRCAVASAANP
jgi:hypothetical protein